jgi:hypothetical protein
LLFSFFSKTGKQNPCNCRDFVYQKLKYYLAGVVVFAELVLAVDLLVVVLLLFAAGFEAGLLSVLAVVVFVEVLDCFDVVDAACADAPKAMVAATNRSARFLIVFICLGFSCE